MLPTFLWDDLAAHLGRNVDDTADAILFPAPAGGFLRYGNFIARHWRPALAKAGLEPCGLHVLRHTCASLLAAAGAPVKAIQVPPAQRLPRRTWYLARSLNAHAVPWFTAACHSWWHASGTTSSRGVAGTVA